jgi:hypothetical protein
LTNDLLKEKMAKCAGYNGKGISLEGFDVFVDKLVELYREIPNDDVVEGSEEEVENEGENEGENDVQEDGMFWININIPIFTHTHVFE